LSKEEHLIQQEQKYSSQDVDHSLLSQIVTQKYLSGDHLSTLKQFFHILFMNHQAVHLSTSTSFIPYLDSSIQNILTSLSMVTEESAIGAVLFASLYQIQNLIVIKTGQTIEGNNSSLWEYFVGVMCLNNLRKTNPGFAYTLGIFKCNPLPNELAPLPDNYTAEQKVAYKEAKKNRNPVIDISRFCVPDKNDRYYVVYERIIGNSWRSFLREGIFSDEELFVYIVQLALTLEGAQMAGFVHYDLHDQNVIMRNVGSVRDVNYTIGNLVFVAHTKFIPTIIDYGYSLYFQKGMPLSSTDMPYYGIYSTRFNYGHDIYKIFLFTINNLRFKRRENVVFNLVTMIGMALPPDEYGILNLIRKPAINQVDWKLVDIALNLGMTKFFATTDKNPDGILFRPTEFIQGILTNNPDFWKRNFSSRHVVPENSLLTAYTLQYDQNRLYNQGTVMNTSSLEGQKSYLHNLHNIAGIQTLLAKNEEMKDEKTVSSSRDKRSRINTFPFINNAPQIKEFVVKLIADNISHSSEYIKNDLKILKDYTTRLQQGMIDGTSVYDQIQESSKDIHKLEGLYPEIVKAKKYVTLYSEYKWKIFDVFLNQENNLVSEYQPYRDRKYQMLEYEMKSDVICSYQIEIAEILFGKLSFCLAKMSGEVKDSKKNIKDIEDGDLFVVDKETVSQFEIVIAYLKIHYSGLAEQVELLGRLAGVFKNSLVRVKPLGKIEYSDL
jgi:hypothetical protein